MACDAAAMIEARAQSIKEKIEQTKSDMLLGNEYVAEGRSRHVEQSKFMSMREVAKRHSSMIEPNSGTAAQSHLKGNSPHRSGIEMTAGVSSSVKSFSPPPNLGDTP